MASAYIASYTFRDAEGNESQARFSLPTASRSYSQAQSTFLLVATYLQSLSNAVLVALSITRKYTTGLSEQDAAITSDIVRCGVFVVSLANDNYALNIVPSIKQSLVMLDESGKSTFVLNDSAAEMVEYAAQLVQSTDRYGTPITGVVIAGVAT